MKSYEALKSTERAAADVAINAATRVLIDLKVRITQDGLKAAREALSRAIIDSRPVIESHDLF